MVDPSGPPGKDRGTDEDSIECWSVPRSLPAALEICIGSRFANKSVVFKIPNRRFLKFQCHKTDDSK